MENVFDSLCSALAEPEIKQLFLDSEGVDLMVLMMKYDMFICYCFLRIHSTSRPRQKMQSRSRSIKVLDYAMSGEAGAAACETFVDALGLKTLFSAFMGKVRWRRNH